MFFDSNKNNTLYVNKTPEIIVDIPGKIAVFYDSDINPTVPQVIVGDKYKLMTFNTLRTFRYSDIKDCDSIFIINIDHIDYSLLFELLMSIPLEVNANTAGGKSIVKIKPFFSNINY